MPHTLARPALSLAAAAALVGGVLALGTPHRADAAVPDTIPLQITNNSGRSDPVYLYDLGTQLSTGRQGWADAGGTFHAWPAGGNPPTPAPDAAITGPAAGQSTTIRIPKFSGRVSGNVMNFTDSIGAVVTSFQKPDASSIFGCPNLLDAPNDAVRGPISRTLCAGYNRSTLLTNPNQPDTSPANFYQDSVTNHYARTIHAQMADGKAYAFAFDDVGNQESLVNDGNPQQAYLTLDPLS